QRSGSSSTINTELVAIRFRLKLKCMLQQFSHLRLIFRQYYRRALTCKMCFNYSTFLIHRNVYFNQATPSILGGDGYPSIVDSHAFINRRESMPEHGGSGIEAFPIIQK